MFFLIRLFLFVVLVSTGESAYAQWKSVPLEISPHNIFKKGESERPLHQLIFLSGLELRSDDLAFGGLSGLTIQPGARNTFWAVSDHGHLIKFDIVRDSHGNLSSIRNVKTTPMVSLKGNILEDDASDAEGILWHGKNLLVSLERIHRIIFYRVGRNIKAQKVLPITEKLRFNGGLETMENLNTNQIFAVSEFTRDDQGHTLALIIDTKNGKTLPRYITSFLSFYPTDLTKLDNNNFLLLERDYTPLFGGQARLRRITLPEIMSGNVIEGEEMTRISSAFDIDNLEGIASLPRDDGSYDIFLLSDDNFLDNQKTLLLHFQLILHKPGAALPQTSG